MTPPPPLPLLRGSVVLQPGKLLSTPILHHFRTWQEFSYLKVVAFSASNHVLSAGLGFEDCSAKVVPVSDSSFEGDHTFVREHEEIAAKAWTFYRFNVSDSDYQIIANVAGESNQDDHCKFKTLLIVFYLACLS